MKEVVTRVMLLTPPGSGAIGVIRVRGPDAFRFVRAVFRPKSIASLAEVAFDGGRIRYGQVMSGDESIDDVLVSRDESAGEPSFDLTAHGGIRVLERLLATFEEKGAAIIQSSVSERTVHRSEAGREASMNDAWSAKDLIEAEVLDALMRARTTRTVKFLASQRVVLPRALEAADPLSRKDPQAARAVLVGILERATAATSLVQGVTVAFVGPPNSGKSTLFNRVVGRACSLVSPRAGTTRDWVSEAIEIEGVPVTLVDTAGRHDGADTLEHRAVEAGAAVARQADLLVWVLDASLENSNTGCELMRLSAAAGATLVALNKVDRVSPAQIEALRSRVGREAVGVVATSAVRGDGLGELVRRIVSQSGLSSFSDSEPAAFTERQRLLLARLLDPPGDCIESIIRTIKRIRGR